MQRQQRWDLKESIGTTDGVGDVIVRFLKTPKLWTYFLQKGRDGSCYDWFSGCFGGGGLDGMGSDGAYFSNGMRWNGFEIVMGWDGYRLTIEWDG